MKFHHIAALALVAMAGASAQAQPSQGVSKDTITLGSIRICRGLWRALASSCATA